MLARLLASHHIDSDEGLRVVAEFTALQVLRITNDISVAFLSTFWWKR